MGKEFDIWDSTNEVVKKAYAMENYECVDTGGAGNRCYIFFSSNGLYFPNTQEEFEEKIFRKNRYEWKYIVSQSRICQKASRIIYVRDIYKQWYSYGINENLNTIEKTLDFLKELTKGYEVITVGSSAGGYMAALTALVLEAKFCIDFSGQYDVRPNIENRYMELSKLMQEMKSPCNIFYFYPKYSPDDVEQYEKVKKNPCIKAFAFGEKNHAATMFVGNMGYIIDREEEELLELFHRYEEKVVNKFPFLFQTVPLRKAVLIMIREIKAFLRRRMGKTT